MSKRWQAYVTDIGLSPDNEFRCLYPGAVRNDGWSALNNYAQEVEQRKMLFEEIDKIGVLPEQLDDCIMMDFGCGLASTAMAIAPRLKLAIGVDSSFNHCVSAIECITHEHIDNAAIYQGSTTSFPQYGPLPFRTESIDLIISYQGFWLKDIPVLLSDWSSLLKQSGHIYIVYPRFWLTDTDLTEDENKLRAYMQEYVSNWQELNYEKVKHLANQMQLSILYRDTLTNPKPKPMTGIVFLSTGIVKSRYEYAELIGDFSLRWNCSQEIMVLQKKGV